MSVKESEAVIEATNVLRDKSKSSGEIFAEETSINRGAGGKATDWGNKEVRA